MAKKRPSRTSAKSPVSLKKAKDISQKLKSQISALQEELRKEKREKTRRNSTVKDLYKQIEEKSVQLDYEIKKFEKAEKKLKDSHKKLRLAKKELEKMTRLDPLTNLLNRRGLQEALTREVQRMRRFATDLVAIIIDLDDFKSINDTLGLAVGDIVLKEVSRRMQVSLRQTDCLARIGGDEFMILLPVTREAEGRFVAEKLRLSIIQTPIYISTKKQTKVQASFGVMAVARRTASVDELLAEINPILKLSKSSGKDMVSIVQNGQLVKSDRQRLVADAIESLREGNRIRAVKQPIVELASGKIVGYEFLSRLTLKEFEMPNDFFQICLEENILTSR